MDLAAVARQRPAADTELAVEGEDAGRLAGAPAEASEEASAEEEGERTEEGEEPL